MQLHANAALGPAGRRRLVGLIEQGHSLRAAAAALSVAPGHRPSLVAPLGRRRSGRAAPGVPAWPTAQAALTAHPGACRRPGGADPGRPRPDQPGPGAARPHLPAGPLDDLQGPCPPRPLAAAPAARGRSPAATSGPTGGPHPHRHRPPGALCARPGTARAAGRGSTSTPTRAWARPSSMWPSTTTAATPTSSSTPTSGRRTCAALPGAAPWPTSPSSASSRPRR